MNGLVDYLTQTAKELTRYYHKQSGEGVVIPYFEGQLCKLHFLCVDPQVEMPYFSATWLSQDTGFTSGLLVQIPLDVVLNSYERILEHEAKEIIEEARDKIKGTGLTMPSYDMRAAMNFRETPSPRDIPSFEPELIFP